MNTIRKYAFTALALAVLMGGILPPPVRAQLDPDVRIYLYENGIRVGEVFVPERVEGQTQYVEHWVLYPNYMYPGPRYIGALQVVPSMTEKPYDSEADFFSRVPFEKGSKYVRVTAQEYNYLPVGR
jgi:hypothetical protein